VEGVRFMKGKRVEKNGGICCCQGVVMRELFYANAKEILQVSSVPTIIIGEKKFQPKEYTKEELISVLIANEVDVSGT
jgi:hypothetical protein